MLERMLTEAIYEKNTPIKKGRILKESLGELSGNDLLELFDDNDWETFDLELDNGDIIQITPYDNKYLVTSNSDKKWFNDIDDMAYFINSFGYDDDYGCDNEAVMSLNKFYKERIAGHSPEDWKLSRKAIDLVYKNWDKHEKDGESLSIVDYLNNYLYEVVDELGLPEDRVIKLLELNFDAEDYSDSYKSIYGVRPRF